jgi:predicted XRE-type DNA-binding protein
MFAGEDTAMKAETFDGVFDALTDSPIEAANMTARADLLLAVRERVRGWNLPQEQAVARLGLTRPASTTCYAASSTSSRWMLLSTLLPPQA